MTTFKVGDRVKHAEYGKGKVIAIVTGGVDVQFKKSHPTLHNGVSCAGEDGKCYWFKTRIDELTLRKPKAEHVNCNCAPKAKRRIQVGDKIVVRGVVEIIMGETMLKVGYPSGNYNVIRREDVELAED